MSVRIPLAADPRRSAPLHLAAGLLRDDEGTGRSAASQVNQTPLRVGRRWQHVVTPRGTGLHGESAGGSHRRVSLTKRPIRSPGSSCPRAEVAAVARSRAWLVECGWRAAVRSRWEQRIVVTGNHGGVVRDAVQEGPAGPQSCSAPATHSHTTGGRLRLPPSCACGPSNPAPSPPEVAAAVRSSRSARY
jgi:hypothetical protein